MGVGPPPLVSVLLAAYRPTHLREAIESVLVQTFTDLELLILDDSREGCATHDLTASCNDSRIRYFPSEHLGVARNHNRGLLASRGRFVAIINHDDVWEPELLRELTTALIADTSSVVAFSDHIVIDDDGRINPELTERFTEQWGRSRLEPGVHRPFKELATVRQALPIAQAAVWTRSAVPCIPDWAGDRYDYWIGMTLSSSGRGALYVPKRLARFRVHHLNLGGTQPLKRRLEGVNFYRNLLRERNHGSYHEHLRKRYRRAVMDVAKWPVEKALGHQEHRR